MHWWSIQEAEEDEIWKRTDRIVDGSREKNIRQGVDNIR